MCKGNCFIVLRYLKGQERRDYFDDSNPDASTLKDSFWRQEEHEGSGMVGSIHTCDEICLVASFEIMRWSLTVCIVIAH